MKKLTQLHAMTTFIPLEPKKLTREGIINPLSPPPPPGGGDPIDVPQECVSPKIEELDL